jgi:glycosyltransferase involved in cell wall biosynthesis
MRILQVFNCYVQPGGEETFVRQLQEIVGPDQMRTVLFQASDWTGPHAPPKWKQASLVFSNPSSIDAVLKAHAEFRPDVWLLGNVFPVGSAALYRVAQERGIPCIQIAHNFRPFSVNGTLWVNGRPCPDGLQGNFWPEVIRKSWRNSYVTTATMAAVLWRLHQTGRIRNVNGWITVSEFMRDRFIEAGLAPERVFALHPFWFAAPSLPEVAEDNYYLFVGRLIPEKGIGVLLQAWDLLRNKTNSPPRLVIAGRGRLEETVRAAAAANPLIQYEGFVSDERKNDLIARCRGMIAPSVFWEPLGAVTYEAYNLSRPMLGARSGGITETVEHGKTGFLHRPGDVEELAGQVLELESDSWRRRDFGKAGRAWLLENTAPSVFKNRLFTIIDQVLRSRS